MQINSKKFFNTLESRENINTYAGTFAFSAPHSKLKMQKSLQADAQRQCYLETEIHWQTRKPSR
jgi:hypothetical protein